MAAADHPTAEMVASPDYVVVFERVGKTKIGSLIPIQDILRLGYVTYPEAPRNLAQLAELIRRTGVRRRRVPELLDYLHDHEKATFDELRAHAFHDRRMDDETIKTHVKDAKIVVKAHAIPVEIRRRGSTYVRIYKSE